MKPELGADRLRLLMAELDHELAQIARLVDGFPHARDALHDPAADTLVVYGAAALIESFYTGMEKALRRVAGAFGGMPTGEARHRDLLASMALDLRGLRPPVLRPSTLSAVDPYLAFRHRFRNLYVFDLERAPMIQLLDRGGAAFAAFEEDVRALVATLGSWVADLDARA